MDSILNIVQVIHILNALLMAWPIYALVTVNQRGRLGPPLGDRTDVFMENIIKNRTIPCFVFQATALISGISLILLRGMDLNVLLSNPIMAAKFFPLLIIIILLAYIHSSIQPRIDSLFKTSEGGSIAKEVAAEINSLRLKRKRIASVCMFVVLSVSMLGIQVWAPFPAWLTVLFVVAIIAFTWRSFKSTTPYGWF
jgi:hypothetical protein